MLDLNIGFRNFSQYCFISVINIHFLLGLDLYVVSKNGKVSSQVVGKYLLNCDILLTTSIFIDVNDRINVIIFF